MHGNAGNKTEAYDLIDLLGPSGISLLTFDFSGCGNSEGEWVTLGWKEKQDLETVIGYLQGLGTVSKIGLWGRSMGAATSIMYMSENNDKVAAAILDSSFSSFETIVNSLAEEKFGLPAPIVQMLMVAVQAQVEQKTGGMRLTMLKPQSFAPNCLVPAMFLHGIDDDFIVMSHTEKNMEAYGSEVKEVQYCEGGHNDMRPEETINAAVNFLKKHLL